jgi:fatty acid desaturase
VAVIVMATTAGLSVTSARWIEWMTLQFGHHVEHHLFRR